MGGRVSLPSRKASDILFTYKKQFSFQLPCPIEKGFPPEISIDFLDFHTITIPLTGDIPPVDDFLTMWMNENPFPTTSFREERKKNYFITQEPALLGTGCPFFSGSDNFSLIRLTNQFTINHLVSTSDIEAVIPHVYTLYYKEINADTLPWASSSPNSISTTPPTPQILLHTLFCRLIYHQIMNKNKMIYYGENEPKMIHFEGNDYVLVQHPFLHSTYFPNPMQLLQRYTKDFLLSLFITNLEFNAVAMPLIRSGLTFHSNPCDGAFNRNVAQSAITTCSFHSFSQFHIPFILLYLDCAVEQSLHSLYSFIYNHLLAHNISSILYNPTATIIVVLRNSIHLDVAFLTEVSVLDVFAQYLHISPCIYHEEFSFPFQDPNSLGGKQICSHYFQTLVDYSIETPLQLPAQVVEEHTNLNLQLAFLQNAPEMNSEQVPLVPNPNLANFTTSPSTLSVSRIPPIPLPDFNSKPVQKSFNIFIDLLNTTLLTYMRRTSSTFFADTCHTPSLNHMTPDVHSRCYRRLEYLNTLPKLNISQFQPLLPLFQTQYSQLLQQLQLNKLQSTQYIPLSMFTYQLLSTQQLALQDQKWKTTCINEDDPPLVKFFHSQANLAQSYNIHLEYLVSINQRTFDLSFYQNINNHTTQARNQPVNLSQFNTTTDHVKIFSPPDTHADHNHPTALNHDGDDEGRSSDAVRLSVALRTPVQGLSDSSLFQTSLSHDRLESFTFDYHGDDTSYIGTPYTATVNYFNSQSNDALEIKIISPDIHHLTQANRTQPLPFKLSNDDVKNDEIYARDIDIETTPISEHLHLHTGVKPCNTIFSSLPMNQILAVDDHFLVDKHTLQQQQHGEGQQRYLIQLTNHFLFRFFGNSLVGTQADAFKSMITNPALSPAITILSSYDVSTCLIGTNTTYQSRLFDSECSTQLRGLKYLLERTTPSMPLFLITMVEDNFNIKTAKLPLIAKGDMPFFGWDFEFSDDMYTDSSYLNLSQPLASSQHSSNRQDEDEDEFLLNHDKEHIAFHQNIILQRMKHIIMYLLEMDQAKLDTLEGKGIQNVFNEPVTQDSIEFDYYRFKQRTVYHFVVKGFVGYLDILPFINQCAIASYFARGFSPNPVSVGEREANNSFQ